MEPKLRLVLIEWEDSHGSTTGWTALSEYEPELLTVRSVGWLLHDTETCKVLVPHVVDPGDDSRIARQGRGEMTIPNRCVVRVLDIPQDGL